MRRPRLLGALPPALLQPRRAPEVRLGLEGWFTLSVRRGGEERCRLRFRNVITDAGLNALGTDGLLAQLMWAAAGTGNTTPSESQTALVTEVGSRSDDNGGLDDTFAWAATYVSVTRQRVFAEGSLLGELAELGLFSAATGGTMWSRVLITDDMGNPTTVEMEADDELVLLYELRLYVPQVDVLGTVAIAGIDYDFTVRACNYLDDDLWKSTLLEQLGVGSPAPPYATEDDALVAIDADPPNEEVADSIAGAPYSAGSFRRRYRAVWDLGTANFATGIGSVSIPLSDDPLPHFQVAFSPKIPKTDERKLKLTFAVTFGRHS